MMMAVSISNFIVTATFAFLCFSWKLKWLGWAFALASLWNFVVIVCYLLKAS